MFRRPSMRLRQILAIVLMSVLFAGLAPTTTNAAPVNPGSPTPDGFQKYLVYMAAGQYDPNDPNYTAPDGMFFQKEIMGRDDAEIEAHRQAAIAFFNQRFGIDVLSHPGVTFGAFMFDPRNEYRAYTVSEMMVPSAGWVVRDGGWRMAVTDPNGITLGGEFAGLHVPVNSVAVFGEYNIAVTGPGKSGDNPKLDPIIIHYQSGSMIVRHPDADGIMFRCELFLGDYDDTNAPRGLAQGISAGQTLANDQFKANIRNVLTFSGLGE